MELTGYAIHSVRTVQNILCVGNNRNRKLGVKMMSRLLPLQCDTNSSLQRPLTRVCWFDSVAHFAIEAKDTRINAEAHRCWPKVAVTNLKFWQKERPEIIRKLPKCCRTNLSSDPFSIKPRSVLVFLGSKPAKIAL